MLIIIRDMNCAGKCKRANFSQLETWGVYQGQDLTPWAEMYSSCHKKNLKYNCIKNGFVFPYFLSKMNMEMWLTIYAT